MAVDWEKFTVASFALWAGDFAYFEERLKELTAGKTIRQLARKKATTTDDLILITACTRLNQLAQKKREFAAITRKYPELVLTAQPRTLHSEHLRATVWRVGRREFVMYAYLTDLSFESRLFEQAKEVAGSEPMMRENARELRRRAKKGGRHYPSRSASWTVEGTPFIQAELSNIGLMRVTAQWTQRSLPTEIGQITNRLQDVLTSLETGSPKAEKSLRG